VTIRIVQAQKNGGAFAPPFILTESARINHLRLRSSGRSEAVERHYLRPSCNEVIHELLLATGFRVGFRNGTQLRV